MAQREGYIRSIARSAEARRDGQDRLVPDLLSHPSGTQNLNHIPNKTSELREKLFGLLLSDDDVRIITPGANITPRRYPLVDLLLPLLTRVRRGPGSP